MKAVIILAVCIVAVIAAPTQISDNNVGDIVSVNVDADLTISNKIDATIVKFIIDILNKQNIQLGGGDGRQGFQITPEMIEMARQMMNRN